MDPTRILSLLSCVLACMRLEKLTPRFLFLSLSLFQLSHKGAEMKAGGGVMWEYRNGAASEGQWYHRMHRREILLTPHNASLNREPLARSPF